MVNVFVINPDTFQIEYVIDSYVSLIWRPAYSEVGDFELYMGASAQALEIFKEGWYLVRDLDVTVSNGIATYKNVMIIKNIDLLTNVENGDFLSITGRELKYLTHSRIVWNMTTFTGTAENAIRQLINENCINPTDSKRVIPTLTMSSALGLTDTIEKQVTGDNVDSVISELCNTYHYGWEIYIHNSALVFRLYVGVNRSYNQTDRPYVIFADNFDNLYNTEYQKNTEEYANCTLIGGEGEGAERVYTTVNNNLSGLERIEVFTDARDISSKTDDDVQLSTADYLKLLQERGKENLAELSLTEGFSGEVLDTAFTYGVDFNLGDTVTVINNYGISRNVLVLSAIDSISEAGRSLIPQFNI